LFYTWLPRAEGIAKHYGEVFEKQCKQPLFILSKNKTKERKRKKKTSLKRIWTGDRVTVIPHLNNSSVTRNMM